MNQTVVDYLQKNKDLYAKEALVAQLRAAGFSEGDIEAGVNIAYGNELQSSTPIPNQFNQNKSKWSFTKTGLILAIAYLGLVIAVHVFIDVPAGNRNNPDNWTNFGVVLVTFPVSLIIGMLVSLMGVLLSILTTDQNVSMFIDNAEALVLVLPVLIYMVFVYLLGNHISNAITNSRKK